MDDRVSRRSRSGIPYSDPACQSVGELALVYAESAWLASLTVAEVEDRLAKRHSRDYTRPYIGLDSSVRSGQAEQRVQHSKGDSESAIVRRWPRPDSLRLIAQLPFLLNYHHQIGSFRRTSKSLDSWLPHPREQPSTSALQLQPRERGPKVSRHQQSSAASMC